MKKVIKWIFSDFKSHPMKTWMIASFSFLVIISYALADIVKRDPILEVYLILLFPILGLIYTVYISRKFFNHSWALSILSLTAYILAYFYILDFNKVTPQDGKTFLFPLIGSKTPWLQSDCNYTVK